MTTYKIWLSDRTRAKRVTVDHDQGERLDQALAEAIGKRCYGLPHLESYSTRGLSGTYQATVRTGPTRGGSTPVKNVWVHVFGDGPLPAEGGE